MSFTDLAEAQTLNYWFNGIAGTQPPSVWIGLYQVAPNDDGTGGTEASGTGYARQEVTAGFTIATGPGTAKNTNAITFPKAITAWGTVVSVVVFDAIAGNAIGIGTVASTPILINEVFQFNPLDLTITLT